MSASPAERREQLKAVYQAASGCVRCPQLAETRTRVVFGAGDADADLMFVGEAPGRNEDEQGVPFVGAAGKLLDQLLEEISLTRADVFVANALKCLKYSSMVQLGDGTWERIGRLVRSRYDGTVMSLEADGSLVPRRVVGWHATPLGDRRVLKLSLKSAKPNGTTRAAIQLTADHPVLTERGYVAAGDLLSEDRVATGQGLSRTAFDVVCGTLLGDGSLNAKASVVTFSHSQVQLAYAEFKGELLQELRPSLSQRAVAAVAGGEPVHAVVHGRTRAHRALRTLRPQFYGERKHVPDWLARGLTCRMLAIWFMDDGHTRIRDSRQPLSEIATNAFSDSDRRILQQGLFALGLPTRVRRDRLFFDVVATQLLSELIAPLVPPSMRYKLVPDVEARISFDPSLWGIGPPITMYDGIDLKDVTDRQLGDRTFFCLDVLDTHNFVTTGGVVHNCRPPGNRDPLGAELSNCQDWLYRQLDLIQPKVVCTLGNHATKLLRGDPTPITRIHGQAEVRVIGPRAVRLMPLYHPAAALYTRSLLDTLREDFARIPPLLELAAPDQPAPSEPEPPPPVDPTDDPDSQLGLF
ncbi:MAG: uracil-DNA glycosylase family protein [Solirubrobacteraceae bacterium]